SMPSPAAIKSTSSAPGSAMLAARHLTAERPGVWMPRLPRQPEDVAATLRELRLLDALRSGNSPPNSGSFDHLGKRPDHPRLAGPVADFIRGAVHRREGRVLELNHQTAARRGSQPLCLRDTATMLWPSPAGRIQPLLPSRLKPSALS